MKKVFYDTHRLALARFDSSLKFRHSLVIISVMLLMISGCGKVNNRKGASNLERNLSFLMMENQCGQAAPHDSEISQKIKALFTFQNTKYPQSFFFVSPRSYNYENPLILSQAILGEAYDRVKVDPNLSENGENLYHLYNESRRYEDQKCSFGALVEKKKNDIRPYLNIAHACYKKYQNEKCDDDEYSGMSPDKESWTRDNTINLCKSFTKEANCLNEYRINQKKNLIGPMVSKYYEKFQQERFLPLFKLRAPHQKYACQKDNGKTVMTIQVWEGAFDHNYLVELLSSVENIWNSKNFSLKLELVKEYREGVVQILPTSKGISYVPDNNNRLVYLSTTLEFDENKHVLAHEFGHVLGFPDCYIEYFDDSKKELVYYEFSKNNTNIMCSLKAGVSVPDDYFSQLSENSCVFN